PEVFDQFAVGAWVFQSDGADHELGIVGAIVPDRSSDGGCDADGGAAGDVDDVVVELELQRAGDYVVDLFLGLVAVSVAAFAAGSGWHQSVGERDLLGLEVIGEESHRSGVLPFEDVGHVGDCADCVVAHLCSCAGRAGASGAPRLTWWWVRKSCSRRSGVGRGVSGGGSVDDVAGTEPSRTNRSIPAGVLSTSTRAVSLSTRNV